MASTGWQPGSRGCPGRGLLANKPIPSVASLRWPAWAGRVEGTRIQLPIPRKSVAILPKESASPRSFPQSCPPTVAAVSVGAAAGVTNGSR